MPALTLSRLVTILGIAAAGACTEPFDPPPNTPTSGSGLTVVPSNVTLAAGETVMLKAELRDQFGDPVPSVTVKWSTSDEAVASVANTGEVLARGAGTASIVADAGGKLQTAAIHVVGQRGKLGDALY